MGEMKIILPDEIEHKFRRIAMKRFGYQKGAMSEAATQAIAGWADSYEEDYNEKNPVDSIFGLLKHVKKTSVQLQHEAWNFTGKNNLHTKKRINKKNVN